MLQLRSYVGKVDVLHMKRRPPKRDIPMRLPDMQEVYVFNVKSSGHKAGGKSMLCMQRARAIWQVYTTRRVEVLQLLSQEQIPYPSRSFYPLTPMTFAMTFDSHENKRQAIDTTNMKQGPLTPVTRT